ncbi:unnamed protein product [Euphydryas editha]|uniref:Doublecortin domain-containing protein n=1 Tax=Euphydryas editha TaxID=104508 RepID=A0AAU9UPF5_EUPED|nr:unnamed protein product [Euphydryas editha]
MNEPNTPDDSRDWNSIDIFLFSNGQEYSPPRKYHLQSDDLRWWDNTKTFLARSQYGSMHSAIDLYSLDGKKIEGPLELKNAAAYVAVKLPDAFIPAGYEKYLFKASRSWEKRQGKLSNNSEIDETAKTRMYLDITTIEQIEEIVSLRMDEDSVLDAVDKTQKSVEKSTIPKLNSVKPIKVYPKKISSDTERTLVKTKNISNLKFSKNENSLIQTKNTPFKPQKCNNKQQISSKYTRCPKLMTRANSVECKTKPNQTRTSNLPKIENINKNNKNVPEKNLPPESDMYKNNQNDVESIHLDTDQKLVDNDPTNQLLEISKNNKDLSEDRIQKYSVSTDNSKGKLNIQLRIKLEDFPHAETSENCNHIKNKRSYITLIKKEMASQVNIDVILGKEIFTLNNNLFLNGKSIESNVTKTEDYINDQDIFVRCTCDDLISKFSVLNGSGQKNIPKLSNETNEVSLESCCTCRKEKIETVDRGVQKSTSSCSDVLLSSTKALNRESINVTKYNAPILQEDPKEHVTKKQPEVQNDTFAVGTGVPLLVPKVFEDKSVQTEWCNVLLQAKCHEDGRYSFHLPSLSLLKQYNIDKI